MNHIIKIIFLLFPLGIFAQDFSEYEWHEYNPSNTPFKSQHVLDILIDDKKDLAWVSTEQLDLFSFDGQEWKHYPIPSDWEKEGELKSMYLDGKGKIWIAGYPGYLLSFDTAVKRWNRTKFLEGHPWIIRSNKKGSFLISTTQETGLLYQYNNGRLSLLDKQYKMVYDIHFKANGNALVAYRSGVYEYEMKADGSYHKKKCQRMFKHAIQAMDFDSQQNLWGASYKSHFLHQLIKGKWHTIQQAPTQIYQATPSTKQRYIIQNVLVLPDDRAAISTQSKASIAFYNGKTWEAYNLPVKYSSDGVEQIKFMEKDSSVWVATRQSGLFVFRKKIEEVLPEQLPQWTGPIEEGGQVSFAPNLSRAVKTEGEFKAIHDKIRIEIVDPKFIDGDIVSVYFNGKILLRKEKVTEQAHVFHIDLKKGENEILLFAHNLGTRPPNTASLKIFDGENDPKEIVIDSDFNQCGRMIITKE